MKKLFLLFIALLTVGGVYSAKTIYLNPGKWDTGNPVFAVWACESPNSNPADCFITMTLVDGTNCYKAEIPDAYTKIIFARCKSGQDPQWNTSEIKDNVWNQTDDITTFADNMLFSITYWHNGSDDGSGNSSYSTTASVSVYSVEFATDKSWTDVYAYAWSEDGGSTVKCLGNWPGTKMTNTGKNTYSDGSTSTTYNVYSKTFISTTPEYIIFNDGTENSSVGVGKTADLTFTNGMIHVDGIETPNLAPFGTATASFSAEPVAGANDGNTGTRWGSNGGTDTEWCQIEWSSNQTFNTIKLLCEAAMNVGNAPNLAFDIQTSDDGITWTTRKHVLGKHPDNNNYITVVLNEPATAKYVRFQGVKKGLYGYSFYEFEVYNIDYSAKTLNSIELSSYSSYAPLGTTVALSAIGKTSENEEIPVGAITWNNSHPSIGTISNDTFNTLATGLTTISATAGGKTSNDIILTVISPDSAPTDASANVLSIYSDTYTSSSTATPSTVGKYNGASWDTIGETTLGVSDNVYHATNSAGFGFGVSQDITNYKTINVSIFPTENVTGHFFIEGVDGGNKTIAFTLTGGQWNKISKDIVSATGTNTYTYFILDNAVDHLFVDNFYYLKLGDNEAITIVNGNSADVYGKVTPSNVASVVSDAGSAAIINLRNVITISETVSINPTNQNAVIVVNGDGTGSGRTPDTDGLNVTANNIVVYGSSESDEGKYYRAKDGVTINLVDDNASQPAYNFIIDAQTDGFTYTRTVAADKWVSYNSPAPVSIPTGVSVYKATDATSSSITFTKQENQYLGANDPVILHNNTNDAVVMT